MRRTIEEMERRIEKRFKWWASLMELDDKDDLVDLIAEVKRLKAETKCLKDMCNQCPFMRYSQD